jgi:hypothetical protein
MRFSEQMKNLSPLQDSGDEAPSFGARPEATLAITRGAGRLFRDMGYAILTEFRLPQGRRADIAALDNKGRLVIAEVKSCEADFTADSKWTAYLPFCDAFYFAVGEAFPHALLPPEEGLIVADGFGGAVIRPAVERAMAAARRKSLVLKFARQAAMRAAFLQDGLR